MKGLINGKAFEAESFFFDGCHKIYLADSGKGYDQMRERGWSDEDIFPIEELPVIWTYTCPLRFISSADLERHFVPQFTPADFEGWDISSDLRFELALMKRDQIEANDEDM